MSTSNLAKVKLTKPHTHDGVKYAAGDTIEVAPVDAAWLQENEVCEPLPKSAEPKTKQA